MDLFAGTGALGLEAISRGAAKATFIERHWPTTQLIGRNAAALGIRDRVEVVFGDAFFWSTAWEMPAAARLTVFCAPPYDFYVDRRPPMLELVACGWTQPGRRPGGRRGRRAFRFWIATRAGPLGRAYLPSSGCRDLAGSGVMEVGFALDTCPFPRPMSARLAGHDNAIALCRSADCRCTDEEKSGLGRPRSAPGKLAPRIEKRRRSRRATLAAFCRGVIDVVAPLVPAVKPQAAFFEQLGPAGMQALQETMEYASAKGLIVILDGKRNDIGSTASAYAEAILDRNRSPWRSDALTVSPYLGDDSLTPFVEIAQQRGTGIFVLVKTSNPGGKRFQDLVADGKPLYRHVGDYVESLAAQTAGSGGYGLVGAVVAAAIHPRSSPNCGRRCRTRGF